MAKTINKNHERLVKLVQIALLTAITVILQLISQSVNLGVFAGAVALIPIIIGAILLGPLAGAWLGFAFGATILLFPEPLLTTYMLTIDPAATIFLVLLKGTLAGLVCGLVFKLFDKIFNGKYKYVSSLIASVFAPVVNTGIFFLAYITLFAKHIPDVAAHLEEALGITLDPNVVSNPTAFVITVLITFNFVFEVLFCIVLAPAIVRIVELGKKKLAK